MIHTFQILLQSFQKVQKDSKTFTFENNCNHKTQNFKLNPKPTEKRKKLHHQKKLDTEK